MAHGNARICQQVTLAGDAEWPKVADAVIEAVRAAARAAACRAGAGGLVWAAPRGAAPWRGGGCSHSARGVPTAPVGVVLSAAIAASATGTAPHDTRVLEPEFDSS
jgi:hypothetical protein